MIKKSTFKPAWWLPNPHLQTIWSPMFRKQPQIKTRHERLELPDGDFIDLNWFGKDVGPIVVLLHGLGGSINSHYVKGMLRAVAEKGWRGVFMHFRGCGAELNRLPRHHHSGETSDLDYVIKRIHQREPGVPMAAIGFSVGGNVLLKWLGETGINNPLKGAVAVSVPFELLNSANHVNTGMARIYQWWIIKDVRAALAKKIKLMKFPVEINADEVNAIRSFWDLDDQITAPLHGFADVYDYYLRASSRQYLKDIAVPTLMLHSSDDPFMTSDIMVRPDELSPQLTFELSQAGGHVGFVSGSLPWKAEYWLERRVPEYLQQVFKSNHF